jgi:hypothetical protein
LNSKRTGQGKEGLRASLPQSLKAFSY